MSACACGENWRIVVCDLMSGRERAVLHPTSFDFQTTLNGTGQGTLQLVTREVRARDIWPHLTSVYITRVNGGDATPEEPVAEFGGLIDSFSAADNNVTSVGIMSFENYLHRRNLREDWNFTNDPQTRIARDLVLRASRGIGGQDAPPIDAIAAPSQHPRDRTYPGYERKNIGQAIEELSQVINGPDWELRHIRRADGIWTTTWIFRDRVGADRGVVIQSDREANSYRLDVDAQDHATVVDAIGSGEEEDQLIATAIDDADIYPPFDAAPAWKDVGRMSTLQSHADGYLEDHREPYATPSFTILGLDPDPRTMRLGDTIHLNLDYGAIAYHGPVRITDISWGVDSDSAEVREYGVLPLERASKTVINQEPVEQCNACR